MLSNVLTCRAGSSSDDSVPGVTNQTALVEAATSAQERSETFFQEGEEREISYGLPVDLPLGEIHYGQHSGNTDFYSYQGGGQQTGGDRLSELIHTSQSECFYKN